MESRPYYSVRTAKNPSLTRLDLPKFARLFISIYRDFDQRGYFQEAFGYSCIDEGEVSGYVGQDIEAFLLRRLRKDNLWPVADVYKTYQEEDMFDVIELLHDLISKPVDGHNHTYGECGWHFSKFDCKEGRTEYIGQVNQILKDYGNGFELSDNGEILSLPEHGMMPLLEASLQSNDPDNVEAIVNAAVLKFRSFRSSIEERKEAVRSLVDVLEFLRPKIKVALASKDESDLFNIANKFAIRHHNVDQQRNYDPAIWLSWMFYFYLATIHAATRLIARSSI